MKHHDDSDVCRTERQDDDTHRVEVVLPRARSIVWLGVKVYLIVVLGIALVSTIVAILGVVVVAVGR